MVDGRIAWIGDELAADAIDADEVVQLQGAWVAPAFVEGHIHLAETGLASANSVGKARSAVELQSLVSALRVKESAGAGRVLLAQGWDDTDWPAPPAAEDLPSDVPTYVARADLHSAVINRSLQALVPGIETLAGWSESGLVRGEAHAAARAAALSLLSPGDWLQYASVGLELCAARGIAAVHEMAGPAITGEAPTRRLAQAVAEPNNWPRVHLWWGELAAFELAKELNSYGVGGDLVVDGSIGSRTAWLREPYADAVDSVGTAYLAHHEIAEHLVQANSHGQRVSFHAIGDAALGAVRLGLLMAEEQIGAAAIRAAGHQVEHAILADADFIDTCARLNIAWSVQPNFAATWESGLYTERLGVERVSRSHPLAAAARAGVALIFGSDSPVTPVAPWAAIRAATTLDQSRALTGLAAFRAHTATANRRAGEPASGELAVGAVADFAAWEVAQLDDAPNSGRFNTDPRSFALPLPVLDEEPSCLLTVRAGDVIFSSGALV